MSDEENIRRGFAGLVETARKQGQTTIHVTVKDEGEAKRLTSILSAAGWSPTMDKALTFSGERNEMQLRWLVSVELPKGDP